MYINVRIGELFRAERSGSCKLGRYIIVLSVMVPSVSPSSWTTAATPALTEAELRILVQGQQEESAK